MPGTDIEELKQGGQKRCVCNIDDWYVENDPNGVKKILCNKCGKDLLESLIQQKVIEAQLIFIEDMFEMSKWNDKARFDELNKIKRQLQSQLNHNKQRKTVGGK